MEWIVNTRDGQEVARIKRQDFTDLRYDPEQPWVLVYKGGRIDRFVSRPAAKEEAQITWARCYLKKVS